MRNGKETRSNGVTIHKRSERLNGFILYYVYYVEGSKNGPFKLLRNAREYADQLITTVKENNND